MSLVQTFKKNNNDKIMHRVLPERIKRWYKIKSTMQVHQLSSSKLRKDTVDQKIKAKVQTKGMPSKAKSIRSSAAPLTRRTVDKPVRPSPATLKERLSQKAKDQLPTMTGDLSLKHGSEQKRPSLKSQSNERDVGNTGDVATYKKEDESSKTTLTVKSEEYHKNALDSVHDQPIISSPKTTQIDGENVKDTKIIKLHCFCCIQATSSIILNHYQVQR